MQKKIIAEPKSFTSRINKKIYKMKKQIFKSLAIIVAISFFAISAKSQNIYFKVGGGYSLGNASLFSENKKTTPTTYNSEIVKINCGKGLNFQGAGGFMVNKNIGIELGLSYLIGGKTETTYYAESSTEIDNAIEILYSRMLLINPALVRTSSFYGINTYARVGLLVGIGSVYSETDETYTWKPTSTVTKTFEKFKKNGGVALGFNSAFGVLYDINKQLSVFSEININNIGYAPTKGEVVEYTVNGADKLGDLTTSQKETEYFNELDQNPNSGGSSSPTKALKQKYPFSSVGVNVGIRFALGK